MTTVQLCVAVSAFVCALIGASACRWLLTRHRSSLRLRCSHLSWDEMTIDKPFGFDWYARYTCWVYNWMSAHFGDGERFWLEGGSAV